MRSRNGNRAAARCPDCGAVAWVRPWTKRCLECGGRIEIDPEIQSAVTTRWATTGARLEYLIERQLEDELTIEERAEFALLRRVADLRDDLDNERNVERANQGAETRRLLTA
jgi:hypothetical protein